MIWSFPVVVFASIFGSWLAVRALAASSGSDTEIGDPTLRAMIGHFADQARGQKPSSTTP
jgi:hypothetical protein